MQERRLAIIIGNASYDDTTLRCLSGPVGDVEALTAVLSDRRIGGFETTAIVNAEARDIQIGISKIAKEASYRDTILIYYSGHGVLDEAGKLYLTGKDTERRLLSATGVSAHFVAQELDRCHSKRQIILLDCCHSGAFDRSAKGSGATVNTALAFEGHKEGQGRYLLTATDETQLAYDKGTLIGNAVHSVFTHFMIEGLKTGNADIDSDGQISLDDLYTYIADRIAAEEIKQKPYKWTYKETGKVFIARNVASRGFDVRSLSSLSNDLQSSIVSAHSDIRLGAVVALSKLINDEDPLVAENSRLALSYLSSDSDPAIASASVHARHSVAELYAVPLVVARGREAVLKVHEEKDISIGGEVNITMIRVPSGKFLMGSRHDDPAAQHNEFPQHAVHLDEFWIAKAPITIQQFARFVNMSHYMPTSERSSGVRKAFNRRNRRYETIGNTWRDPFGRNTPRPTTREHPVVLISWYDAIAFCKWASAVTGRMIDLPTEAQWEKSSRGVDGRLWPWGNESPGETLCNFNENNRQTTPVGTYSPDGDSVYGCVDMAGNAWEWTNSAIRPYPFVDEYDGSARSEQGMRVLRGGSWRVKAYRVRCAFRKPWKIQECIDGHGFRVVAGSL